MRFAPAAIAALCCVGSLLAPRPADAAHDCALQYPEHLRQGSLVFGKVDPKCTLSYGGHRLRLDGSGGFVFGLGRDAPASVELSVDDGSARPQAVQLKVERREFPTERVDGVPPDTVSPPPAIAERIAREQALVAAARTRDDAREDYAEKFIWPVHGRVSGRWGSQRILNGTPKDPHYGLDIAAATGTPVLAPTAGVIIFSAPDLYLTGGTVVLDHGHGVSSTFIHLSRVDVKLGDRLRQGQTIGAVGMTGRASGPHLHWGMNWFEVRVDPQMMLPP